MKRWFLTVDRCNTGRRGIFCSRDGEPFPKDTQHTEDEMREVLGIFWLVLDPKSHEFSEEDLKRYSRFQPLGEYTNQYGIAHTKG